VEKKLIFPFSAIIAVTSFVQNIGCQKITDVSSCTRSEQSDLEKIRFKDEKVLEGKVL
jgi:hypothetical protein